MIETNTNPIPLIGLTGGIGSGKSLVSELLRQEWHLPVIDADRLARQVVEPGTILNQELQECFGSKFFDTKGRLKRADLAAHVFSNPTELKKLNERIHPAIRQAITETYHNLSAENPPIIILDAPLLYENGLDKSVAKVIVVWANKMLCLKRLKKYRKMDPEDAQKRMAHQIPLQRKKKWANYVINNTGSTEKTRQSTEAALKQLSFDLQLAL